MNNDQEMSACSSGSSHVNEEEASLTSIHALTNSLEGIFQETDTTCQDLQHTTGAECKERSGTTLKERVKDLPLEELVQFLNSNFASEFIGERVKDLPLEERRRIIQEAIEEQRFKQKYFENLKKKEDYDRQIEEAKKKIEELSKNVSTLRQENKERRDRYYASQKTLEDNESELCEFKEVVKTKLKKKKEIDRMKEEKEEIERSIRINSRKTLEWQKKLFNKAGQERKIKKNFANSLNFLEEISKDLKNNEALPAKRQEELESKILDWKMQLHLYEDSNLDEIKALHDGYKKMFNAGEQKDDEKVLQKNKEKDSGEISIVHPSTSSLSEDKNKSDDLIEVVKKE